jgi:hypothetical protein
MTPAAAAQRSPDSLISIVSASKTPVPSDQRQEGFFDQRQAAYRAVVPIATALTSELASRP